MYNTDYSICTKCKGKATVPYYCCNPLEYVCTRCSIEICKKCRHRRTHPLPSDYMVRKEPIMTKIIKCDECLEPQSLSPADFYYDSKCKVHYCHCCMVKFYNLHEETVLKIGEDVDKIDMPVDLKCGCELTRKETLDYLKPFCFYCSQMLYGSSILLKNSCKISLNCYKNIKRFGQSYFSSTEEKKACKFIEENTMYCMNCELMIDGQNKVLGNKIDGFYVCSLCLDSSTITQNAFKYYKPSEDALRQPLVVKEKYIKNEKLQESSPSKKDSSNNSARKQKDKEQIVKKSIKQQNKQRKPIELGKKNKPHLVNGSKYYQTRCKECKIGISKLHGEQPICECCEQKKPLIHLEPTVSKHQPGEKLFINENIKKKEINQDPASQQYQERIPLIQNSLNKQPTKQNQETNNHQQQQYEDEQLVEIPMISMNQLQLQSKKSSINQQFLPLKVQKLKIESQINEKQSRCCKCNFIVQQQQLFRAYQKQSGNAATLRITEEQSEIQKYIKQKRLILICTPCYLSIKLKAVQQKKAQEQASSRHRSVSHKPKREQPALTYTNVKKVEERRHMKVDDSLCYKCYKWVPQTQLNNDRKCKNCQQVSQFMKAKCRRCLKELNHIPDKSNIYEYCRYCMVNISLA